MKINRVMNVDLRSPRIAHGLLLLGLALALPRLASAEMPRDSIADIIAQVKPAVVEIIVVKPKQNEQKPDQQVAEAMASFVRRATAIGSGFLIDPSGYIATNKHVVENAVSVFVATPDGVRYQAQIVGMAAKADMALLKISASKAFPVVRFGDSNAVRAGDTVIAIGSPFGFDESVTAGIVSAVDRDIMESPFDDYIQTDAAINHGNSGGPLLNVAGEVIGMTSVLFAPGTYSGSAGVNFAIPARDLQFVMDRLMEDGKIRAGMLPLRTQPVTWMVQQAIGTPSLQGALVAALEPGGSKMTDGQIKPGDVILLFNEQTVIDPRDLARKAARTPIGSDAALTLWRQGGQQVVHVKIQAWPEANPHLLSQLAAKKVGLEFTGAQKGGAKVASVDPSGSAADSGIERGDIVLQVQQEAISSPDQALRALFGLSTSRYALLLIQRDETQIWIPIALPNE